MKSLFKWAIIGLLVIILLPVVVGLVVINFIDPNDFKPRIAAWVQNNSRGELSINGDLDWSFYPNIGVNLNDVSFRLPEDNDKALANLKTVKFSVKTLPLLRGMVEADGMEISGLQVLLETSEAGVNNWARIFPEKPEKESAQAEDTTSVSPADGEQAERKGSTATPFNISIAEVAVRNSSVKYHDRKKSRNYQFNNVNINSTGINTNGEVYPLELKFETSLSDPEMSAAAKVTGRMSSDLESGQFSFADTVFSLILSGPEFADKTVDLELTTTGSVDRKAGTVNLEELNLDAAGVLRANLQLDVENFLDKPVTKGTLAVEPFSLNELLSALGQEPRKFNRSSAMNSIAVDATIGGPENSIVLSPLTINLDDSTLSGLVGVNDLDTRAYVVNLQGDVINLDDYSAPPDSDEGTSSNSQPNAALLPIAALQPLLFNASLAFQKIQASGLNMTDLLLDASGNKGIIALEAVDVKLYDGLLTAHGDFDTNPETPTLNFVAQLNGVDLGPLLADSAKIEALRGKANIAAEISARGNSSEKLINSLNGQIDFNLQDGAVEGINADRLVCEAIALVRNETLDKSNGADNTPFEHFAGGVVISDGVANNNDLVISSETMDLNGQGTLDISSGSLDYRISMRIKDGLNKADAGMSQYGEACRVNERYQGIAWPIRCKGQIEKEPGELCGVDREGMTGIVAELAGAELKRKLLEKYVDEEEVDPDTGEAKESDPTELLKKNLIEKLF